MSQSDIPAPLEDIAFLVRSAHRVIALETLAEGPTRRCELQERTGASSSTISRLLRQFEARQWVVREGHHYEATELGAFVATGLCELRTRIETERTLRAVWQWLPTEDGLTLEMVANAVVTRANTSDPYHPVYRFEALLENTDRFRFVGSGPALLEPCRDLFRRRVLEGMVAEIIDPPSVARSVRSTHLDPIKNEALTVLIHDTPPPYGVALFDERVGICCHHPVTGTVQAFLDTASPAAREWAERTYRDYRHEARPLAADLEYRSPSA